MIANAMQDWLQGITLAVGIPTIVAGITAALWAVTRVRGMQETITLLATGNDALRDTNSDLRQQLQDQELRFARELSQQETVFQGMLHAQEVECNRQISLLQGQLDALQSEFSGKIIANVARAVAEATTQHPSTEGAQA